MSLLEVCFWKENNNETCQPDPIPFLPFPFLATALAKNARALSSKTLAHSLPFSLPPEKYLRGILTNAVIIYNTAMHMQMTPTRTSHHQVETTTKEPMKK